MVPIEVSPNDKVSDIVKRISISTRGNHRDTYVTSGRRVLRRSKELRSCGVSGGSTIQVTNRMPGGGKHKDQNRKRSAKEERTEHNRPQKKKRLRASQ